MQFEPSKLIPRVLVVFGVDAGNLTCTPAVVHATRDTAVTFRNASGGPFAVQSKGISPLMKADFRSTGEDVTVSVRENAEPGVYSFACAVYADGHVYLDAACPGMSIDW